MKKEEEEANEMQGGKDDDDDDGAGEDEKAKLPKFLQSMKRKGGHVRLLSGREGEN